jgi:hypothetical protein
LKNAETSQIFAATFFCGESCVLIVAKNGLGYALGDFFPVSPAHGASEHTQNKQS